MRRFTFTVLAAVFLPISAGAQLAVELRLQRETFLRYESIPVTVSIRNFSGRSVRLQDDGEHPWLDFVVADEKGGLISAIGKRRAQEPLAIAAGQTVTQTLDLLPVYDLRTRGNYRVQAVLNMVAARTISAPVSFTIVHGRELWRQTVGLPTGGSNDEYRTYSLLTRRDEHYDFLYVCVEDQTRELIYGTLPLGVYLATVEPDARLDKAACLHVLYRTGPRTSAYAHVDPQAKILDRAAYSDLLSEPRLAVDEAGQVAVTGGEKTFPREQVVIDQPAAQPPPPQEKHKKSWWPFGRRKPPQESVPTNSPARNFEPR